MASVKKRNKLGGLYFLRRCILPCLTAKIWSSLLLIRFFVQRGRGSNSGLGSLIMAAVGIQVDEFPTPSRRVSGLVNGVLTEITSLSFSDKILVTISQEGRLSQWIQVPFMGSSAGPVEMTLPSLGTDLLPSTHLTPKTLLGGGGNHRETIGQLYATQIASHLSLKSPEDMRTLILGLGLAQVDMARDGLAREVFFDLFELVQKAL